MTVITNNATMSEENLELSIICSQEISKTVISLLREFNATFRIEEERGFAPSSPDIAIRVLLKIAEWLPLVAQLVDRLWKKKAYIDFESRHRLARRMLADLEPLLWTKGEDTPQYSRYEFKTAKCKHYWELDNGEIRHGPLRCS